MRGNMGIVNKEELASPFIIRMLPQVRKCFAKHPVDRAWLFGSYSRGEETEKSDIDFLVEYSKDDNISLLTTARLYRSLKDMLGKEIDVVEEGYLLPYAEETANRDKVLIYERKTERQGKA